MKANIRELIASGATKLISKSLFLRFRILVVTVVIEFTKSPLTRAISKDKPTILRVGTSATAEPNPAIAKIVESIVVVIKYIRYSNVKRVAFESIYFNIIPLK